MWPLLIIIHVVIGSLATILSRKLSLVNKRAFFAVGMINYLVIALIGLVISIIAGIPINYWPDQTTWLLLIPAGFGIAAAWLLMYRIISLLGAGNAILVSVSNYIGTALLGYFILGEGLSPTFLLGAGLIIASTLIVFMVRSDSQQRHQANLSTKLLLVFSMAVIFSIGMLFEKLAIDHMGVWEYARYGWLMQFVGALAFMLIIGRREILATDRTTIKHAAFIGLATGLAGIAYITALSIGTLSGTIIAASAKLAMTSALAYLLLRERNAPFKRLAALLVAITGLWLIF